MARSHEKLGWSFVGHGLGLVIICGWHETIRRTSLLARSYSALRSSTDTAVLSLCSRASRVMLALYVRKTCTRHANHEGLLTTPKSCSALPWRQSQH